MIYLESCKICVTYITVGIRTKKNNSHNRDRFTQILEAFKIMHCRTFMYRRAIYRRAIYRRINEYSCTVELPNNA